MTRMEERLGKETKTSLHSLWRMHKLHLRPQQKRKRMETSCQSPCRSNNKLYHFDIKPGEEGRNEAADLAISAKLESRETGEMFACIPAISLQLATTITQSFLIVLRGRVSETQRKQWL